MEATTPLRECLTKMVGAGFSLGKLAPSKSSSRKNVDTDMRVRWAGNKKPPCGGFLFKIMYDTAILSWLIGSLKCRSMFDRYRHCLFGRGLRKEGQNGSQNHEACRNGIGHAVIACAICNSPRQNGTEDSADAVGRKENSVIQPKILGPPVVPAG